MVDILVLIGKTASGKDTISDELIKRYGYKRIITYCTRPLRNGEVNGKTYHFINEDDFVNKVKDGFFAEFKTYDTKFGTWYYGTALEDLEKADSNSIIILTPNGYRDIVKTIYKKPISIYLYANDETIKKRLIKRGDNPEEAERRLLHDNDDFKGIENEVDKIVYNNDYTNIDDIVKEILEFVNQSKGDDKNRR